MECERLNRLVRSWYLQVQDESLAPARMVEFMEKHIMDCDVCLTDSDVRYEVKKITAIVLPPSKMTKQPKQEENGSEAVAPPESNSDDTDTEDNASKDDESVGADPELVEDDDAD